MFRILQPWALFFNTDAAFMQILKRLIKNSQALSSSLDLDHYVEASFK